MKVHAVKDESGKVVSTFEMSKNGVSIEPVLKRGQKVEEIEVSANYKHDPKEVYKA